MEQWWKAHAGGVPEVVGAKVSVQADGVPAEAAWETHPDRAQRLSEGASGRGSKNVAVERATSGCVLVAVSSRHILLPSDPHDDRADEKDHRRQREREPKPYVFRNIPFRSEKAYIRSEPIAVECVDDPTCPAIAPTAWSVSQSSRVLQMLVYR